MMKKELISYICDDIKRLAEQVAEKDDSEYQIICIDVEDQDKPVNIYFSGLDNKLYIYVSMAFDKFNYLYLLNSTLRELSEYFIFNKLLFVPIISEMKEDFSRNIMLDRISYDLYNKKYLFKENAIVYNDDLVLSTAMTKKYIDQKEFLKNMFLKGSKSNLGENIIKTLLNIITSK